MPKLTLSKTIEAVKVNKRTGIPTGEAPVTIPYGAILENLTERGDRTNFSYLGEPYQGKTELLREATGALPSSSGARTASAGKPPTAPPAGFPRDAALKWETVSSGAELTVRRVPVPGGWLVALNDSGLTFYPDPDRSWRVGSGQ